MSKLYFVTTCQDSRIHGYHFTREGAEEECTELKREDFSREIFEIDDSDDLTNEYAEIGTSREGKTNFIAKLKAEGKLVLHNA